MLFRSKKALRQVYTPSEGSLNTLGEKITNYRFTPSPMVESTAREVGSVVMAIGSDFTPRGTVAVASCGAHKRAGKGAVDAGGYIDRVSITDGE